VTRPCVPSGQVVASGCLTAVSEKVLEQILPTVALDFGGEDNESGLAALGALFAVVKDTQLVPLFHNASITDPLKVQTGVAILAPG
jgi:hypothetical protein